MRRGERVAVVVTGGLLLAAGVWLPTSLTPPFAGGTCRPTWPEVVAFQPVWRAPLSGANQASEYRSISTDGTLGLYPNTEVLRVHGATVCAIDLENGIRISTSSTESVGFLVHLGETTGLARAGVSFAGIEWTSAMVGGHVHWPMLFVELLAIAGFGSLTVIGLRIRARRAADRALPDADEAVVPPAALA